VVTKISELIASFICTADKAVWYHNVEDYSGFSTRTLSSVGSYASKQEICCVVYIYEMEKFIIAINSAHW
jgi:hypothetical protein